VRCAYPATVRLHLCRHAEAAPGEPDELRELTQRGIEQAQDLGERLADLADPPQLVVSSPLLRARQTATEIARLLGAPVRVAEELAPGATIDSLRRAVDGQSGPVAVVGHQPDCSEIAYAVIGRDPGFPVAGVVELDIGA
jgi:phosphohistidine phosphatase SixA